MKKTKPNLSEEFKLPNPGLRAYFSHVREGQADDYRTPFWKGRTRLEVLEAWDKLFSSNDAVSEVPGLTKFEYELRDKVGPLSVQLPLAQRLESIEHYYTLINAKSVPIDPRAIEETWKSFSRAGGLRMRQVAKVVQKMRLSTNSGAPDFEKRRRALPDVLEAIQTRPFVIDHQGKFRTPAVLGWRGQEGGPNDNDVKQRVVWMVSMLQNVQEGRFYQPAIEAWQKNHINSAYENMRAVEVKLTKLFDTKGDDFVIVTDFSKFDQHFNSDLQEAALELELRMLGNRKDTMGEWWRSVAFPYKFNVSLVCSPELEYTGAHGMASGSTGTNFDECCAHTAMQHEVAILNGTTLNPYSNAYGDDGYLSFKGIDVDKVISAYTSHGQEMNPDKQSADKHSAVYLRRYFHDSYRDKQGIMLGIYSTFRALGRLLGQERYFDPDVWSAKMVELRALSIIENCNNHPAFNQFVDFVMSGDRYRLGLDIPGFLDSLPQEVKKATELVPDFMGYTKTLQGDVMNGINNWRVVKYLKSKR